MKTKLPKRVAKLSPIHVEVDGHVLVHWSNGAGLSVYKVCDTDGPHRFELVADYEKTARGNFVIAHLPYISGQEVWLKADATEDWPRQRAKYLAYQSKDCHLVEVVKRVSRYDDGLREVTGDQIETAPHGHKPEECYACGKRLKDNDHVLYLEDDNHGHVFVGPDCWRKGRRAGVDGITTRNGKGPRVFFTPSQAKDFVARRSKEAA